MASTPPADVPRYADMGNQRVDKVFHLGAFFRFYNQTVDEKGASGWKLHFSADPAHLEAAWEAVAGAMIDHGVGLAKVVDKDYAQVFNNPDYHQAGKMITVYDHGEAVDWQGFVQDVEDRMLAAGVKPGPGVHGDKPVQGSLYAAYRNDKSPQGAYVSSDAIRQDHSVAEENRHNPYGLPDPLADKAVSHDAFLAQFGDWQSVTSLERNGQRSMHNTGIRVEVGDKTPEQKAVLMQVLEVKGLAAGGGQAHHPDIQPDYISKGSGKEYLVVFAPSDEAVSKSLASHGQDKAQKSAQGLVPDLQKAMAGTPEAQASPPALANERGPRGGQGMSR